MSLPPAVERGRGREGQGLPMVALKAGPEVDEVQEQTLHMESVMAMVLHRIRSCKTSQKEGNCSTPVSGSS